MSRFVSPYWNEEREAILKECMKAGASRHTIFMELKGEVSRAAIARKIKKILTPKPVTIRKRKPAKISPKNVFKPLPETTPIPLWRLEYDSCRWPVTPHGSHEKMYCGLPRDPLSVYCPVHRHLARDGIDETEISDS